MEIGYISYKQGMLKKPSQRKLLKTTVLRGTQITDEFNDILSISGTMGIKNGYSPIEYEEIKIKAGGKVNIIRIYNKGMSMMTPELKRVFKFCNKLFKLTQ